MKTPVILRIFKHAQLLEVKQFEQNQIIFGRDADVQVDLKDPEVSSIHCLIELRDSGYYICDLGSTTGTFKNDQQILDEPMSSGDQIKIGPFIVHFFVGVPKPVAPPVPAAAEEAPAPATEPVKLTPVAPAPAAKPTTPVEAPKAAKPSNEAPPAPAAKVPKTVPPVAKNTESAKVTGTPAPKLPEASKSNQKAPSSSGKKHISGGTFAPTSSHQSLKEILKPGKGANVEVIVAWKERVLSTHIFNPGEKVTLGTFGSDANISVPAGFVQSTIVFVDNSSGCRVSIPAAARGEIVGSNRNVSSAVALEQGELLMVSFENGIIQIFIRYAPQPQKPLLLPFMNMSSSDTSALIGGFVMVALMALYVTIYTPPEPEEKPEEDKVMLAQVIFNNQKPTPPPRPEPTPPPEVVKAATPTPTPEQKKVIKVTEKEQPKTQVGKKDSSAKASEKPAARAAEVRPIPSNVNRPKKFTSAVAQGAAVKVGETEGANAQSAKDVTKTGLMAAFGGGGTRSKLDKAYSGAGDLIGMANEATGAAGQNTNRAGDDIGSKFKDTGAGGKGTATTGISGIGTKGRSSGQSAYGGLGTSGKGSVAIEAGGADAEFIGTIDREAVRRVVRSKLVEIKSCYERALNTDKSLEGKVVIRFVIEEQGRVRVATTKSSTLHNRQVEECVAARIKSAVFPEPPQGTVAEVDYPFVFGSQN